MIYFIDFDGTICPYDDSPPSPACIRVLNRLRECNHRIIIYSCRSNPECVEDYVASTEDMKRYLDKYKIPYDGIQYNKPYFNFCIDDRNIGVPLDSQYNVDWEGVEKLIEGSI